METQKEIKLFVDAHAFDNEYQGTRTFIREIYKVLALKKELKLYIGAFDIANLKRNFPLDCNITFVAYKSRNSIKRLLLDIPFIIHHYKIDYAHFQYITPFVKNCRFITTIHDVIFNNYPEEFSFFYRLKKNLLYGLSAHRSDIITSVSNYSKVSIQKFLKINSKEIKVTPNGVSKVFFEPYSKVNSQDFIESKFGVKNYILYVSRFEPRKNHLLLLKSFLDLKLYEQGFFLVLLGHTSIKILEFEKILNRLPDIIRSYIFINSEINDDDLLHFYRGAKLFVYPSKAEGFGIPPLEAAALKVPVICSNTSAMSDFEFFGSNHVDPNNEEDFKGVLRNQLSEQEDFVYLNEISNIVLKDYSWKQSAEILYQSILKNYLYKKK